MEQLLLEIGPAEAPSLANFVPGANAEVIAALRLFAGAAPAERMIYLWGAPGSGRSHLLRAVQAALGRGCVYAAAREDRDLACLPADPGSVLVDDVEQLSELGQQALFALCDRVREANVARLLAAGDRAPQSLLLRADVATRLAWGLVYQVHGLTDEQKVEALRARATQRGFDLPAEAGRYLLVHARRDLASLMALLDALDRYSLRVKRPVTLALVREVLQSVPGPRLSRE